MYEEFGQILPIFHHINVVAIYINTTKSQISFSRRMVSK